MTANESLRRKLARALELHRLYREVRLEAIELMRRKQRGCIPGGYVEELRNQLVKRSCQMIQELR